MAALPSLCDDGQHAILRACGAAGRGWRVADQVGQIFPQLGRFSGLDALARECSPRLDGLETNESIEILMHLPRVEAWLFASSSEAA